LNGFAALNYGPELDPLKAQVEEATALLNRCIDHLKEQESVLIDYYASDLADVAVGVLNCWLVLRDARSSERKRDIATVYIAEAMPTIHSKVDVLRAIDPTPLEARETVLAETF